MRFVFGAECEHNFGVCGFFPAVLGDVVIVNDVEFVDNFDTLACFVMASNGSLTEMAEFVCV